MKQNVLNIALSDSNRPHIESNEDYENSLFKQQYDLSFSQVNSILAANRDLRVVNGLECNNNIIVFDGERGSGKTSCMLSVANMLAEGGDIFSGYDLLSQQRFIKLPMLEPSFFDKEHNAVTLFVSRLYNEYLLRKNGRNDEQSRHELLNQFVNVQQSIKCIFGDFEPKDGLEYLVELSSAVDLRGKIYSLIEAFLKFIKCDNFKLLILIDDIDINPEMAEDMAEQIRKYLVLPNTIVLMSMKIDQLNGILKRNYSKEYDKPLTNATLEEIDNRVEKYVTKLFPRMQRIYMPLPESLLNSRLRIEDAGLWNYNLPDDILIRQVVPELIFQKTRYLFYNTNKRESYIVPRNLRDLRQLLQLLLLMPDYSDEKEEHPHLENKRSFKKYLFEDWTSANFNENQRFLASQLVAVEELEELNYTTLKILTSVTNRLSGTLGNSMAIMQVLDRQNNTENISLGDVFSVIKILENAEPDESVRKFIFFIKSLYSIRMYEAYDTITMSRERGESKKSYSEINKGLHRTVSNDYEAIIGGNICNAEVYDYLPKVSGGVHISTRYISKDSLVTLANKCVADWDHEKDRLVKLVEIIMLSVHYDDVFSEHTQNSFRRADTVCYRTIHSGCKDLRFDLGAFIFNLCRLKDAIERFRSIPELNDFFAKYGRFSTSKGIAKDFVDLMETEQYKTKEHKTKYEKWLSFCCFRNSEILDDFLNYIRGRIPKILSRYLNFQLSEPVNAIILFFRYASKYRIKSYDRFDAGEHKQNAYEIHFKFYEIVYKLLTLPEVKDEFKKVFNSREIADGSNNEIVSP